MHIREVYKSFTLTSLTIITFIIPFTNTNLSNNYEVFYPSHKFKTLLTFKFVHLALYSKMSLKTKMIVTIDIVHKLPFGVYITKFKQVVDFKIKFDIIQLNDGL